MLPALILAAGVGSRLDPLTRVVAKAAVPLAGPTLIERVIAGLRAQGVTDVVINLHHRPESITAVVGDGAHLGVRVRYSWEAQVLGSAGGPRHALPLLEAPAFLIVNGDTLTDVPLEPLVALHRRTGAAVTVAVVRNPRPDHYNGLEVDDEGWVTRGRLCGDAQDTWHFIGVQVVNFGVFASLADGVPAETIHGAYRTLMRSGPGGIRAERLTTPVLDVGTPGDYLAAALTLAHAEGLASAIDAGPGAVPSSSRIANSVVWPKARIGADVVLDRCIVAGEVSVPAGFVAERLVILPAAVAGEGDEARIVGDLALFPLR
jgi:NDP-sugar pyrophosphorylase family protein